MVVNLWSVMGRLPIQSAAAKIKGNERPLPLLLVLKANGLTHIEMHTHVLMTLHGMSALHRGEKTPFTQRFKQ
jgi:hypothetical protein